MVHFIAYDLSVFVSQFLVHSHKSLHLIKEIHNLRKWFYIVFAGNRLLFPISYLSEKLHAPN